MQKTSMAYKPRWFFCVCETLPPVSSTMVVLRMMHPALACINTGAVCTAFAAAGVCAIVIVGAGAAVGCLAFNAGGSAA